MITIRNGQRRRTAWMHRRGVVLAVVLAVVAAMLPSAGGPQLFRTAGTPGKGLVQVPDHPDEASFAPNQLSGIQTADPSTGVSLIAPPGATSTGDARLAYPLEVPPGRANLQPQLSVQYNSVGGDGWLGMGWDLGVPSITVDTRFGVPRYDGGLETETYLMGGQELTPVANRGQFVARSVEKVFHTRVEGSFQRIVRHGGDPRSYSWEIVDKSGTHSFYGGTADSTLTDGKGDVFVWALREVRDSHGNVMRYQTVRQDDPGVAAGSVLGSNLYLSKITYTGDDLSDGPYAVTFTRDRELNEPRRPDISIDARGGFKRVTADLLRKVEVSLNGQLVRRYEFSYQTGAYDKTLLKSVAQFGADGNLFTTHGFEYFDDVRDGSGQYQAFTPVDWKSPRDNLSNGAVNAISGGAGEAGAINGNTSTAAGGHLYVGFGVTKTKAGSVGVKTGFDHAEDTGLVALVDVDGDNLPDKVFVSGGVVYRKNLGGPNGQPRFDDVVRPLQNLPGILSQTSNSLTVGVEGYPGAVAAQLDHVDTFATTSRYFADVNGDGIADLVDGGSVLFGRIGGDGAPTYGLAGATPVPIGSAPVNPDGLLADFTADRERELDSHPLVDTVRRWVAPFDGTVAVTGTVKLIQDTSPARTAYAKADGVRVAVQHEGDELWSQVIGPTDYTEHTPDGVASIPVKRGDRLYFRIQSRSDGAFDQVAWDPAIGYVGAPETTDVNGLRQFQYQASRDFTLAGRATTVTVPVTGTMHLSGALTKRGVTTDDVTVTVTRDGDKVFEKTMPADQTGDIPTDTDVPVTQGQQLQWRVRVDSPIDLDQISWTPEAHYTAAPGIARLTTSDGNPALSVQPPYDIDMYPVDDLTAPQQSYTVPATGALTVAPTLAFDFGDQHPNATVVFTVKRPGALLGKKVITITNGQVPSDLQLTVQANAGDQLLFDYSTVDSGIGAHVTDHPVRAGPDPANLTPMPSAFHSSAQEGAFAQPYRGWGVVGYNGNRDRADQPIAQNDLVADPSYRDQLPTSVDPVADRDKFAADPRITPPKFFQFTPSPAANRWGAGDMSWASRDSASSSRLGGPAVNLPTTADLANITAVPRISRSTQISLTGSVSGGVGSVGGSVASGDTTGELDYLDMNGDGFPDVVGSGAIQYTDPTGTLGGTRSSIPDGNVRATSTTTGNASAGSAARTISTGRGYSTPPANTTANTSDSGNDMPPLGVGGDLGSGSSTGKYDLLDVNGDGLPDRVYSDGRVALNLGYQFAAPEAWPGGGAVNDGTTKNSGVNIGFNTDFYGFAGGASFSNSVSSAKSSLIDVNGDGLADRVFDTAPMQVALNTGSGFDPPRPFFGSLSGINADVNAKLGGGAYVEFGVCFLLVAGCIVINPGADVSTGGSRTEQALRDINGDGFVDQLRSTNDGELVVAENKTGRTNLLKSVLRPLGSRVDLDYTRDGNTYDQPSSKYVLSRVTVNDGHPGDGQDVQLTTFRYSGGHYDRLEREFLGYHSVVEEQRDAAANEAVLRSITREYLNDSHYTQGLLSRQSVSDGAGNPFQESTNSYLLKDVFAPSTPADPKSTTATIFPQLTRADLRIFEGQATPGKTTFTEMSYDDVGNMVRSFDAGDTGPADDVETLTQFTAADPACQSSGIVGVANAVDVRTNGTVLRHRESTVDCVTGDVTQQRSTLADGTSAVTDLSYFPNGTISSITNPPNEKGQRYRLDYRYDPVIASHVTTITDSFGLRSTSTYDLRFGQQDTTTDVNNQQVRYSYDTVGRISTVTGPYEIADNHTTIAFDYHPEAGVPYAVSHHIDRNSDGSVKPATIDTITFVDGLKRVLQTKKSATVSTGTTTPPADVMTVSGHAVFDALGRTVAQSYPVTEPVGPANTTFNPAVDPIAPTQTTYDVLDRTTRVTLPDNTVTTTAYGFGQDRDGSTQQQTTVTDANGNVRRTYTNIRQLTTAIQEASPAAGQPVVWTSYGYDALSQLTSVTDDHDNVTASVYDNFGRQTVLDSPDAGRTETTYDLADNPIRKLTSKLGQSQQTQQIADAGTAATPGAGKAIRYVYDFNRLTEIHYPVFDRNNVTYTYGPPGAPNNGAGRIVRQTDAAGSVDRQYGPLGEVTQETRTIPGFLDHDLRYTTSYRFDAWNRIQQMTYPDGEVLSYHYNSGGLVDSATGVKGKYTYPYLTSLQYDKFDQRALQVTGNGVRTQYTYNADNRRLATLQATQSTGKQFQNLNYGYDNLGNITSVANNVPSSGPLDIGGPSTQTFGYDNLNRLTSSHGDFHPNQHDTDHYDLSMAYDSINNVTAKTQRDELDDGPFTVVKPSTTYGYNYAYKGQQPHAATDVGPLDMRYDANGNLVDQIDHTLIPQRRQMVWDEENRLACSKDGLPFDFTLPQTPSGCGPLLNPVGPRFVYDDKGDRIIKDGGPLDVTIYPNQTYTQHNLTAVKHIFIGDTRLVSKQVEPDRVFEADQFYYHPDNLGSTSYGTNVDGRVVTHQQYFPSGETWVDEGGANPAYQFSGKELDQETGLYYYGSRYYNPRTAAWQSPDPALGDYVRGTGNQGVYNPANLAGYSYSYNNPVKFTDPDGRMAAAAVPAVAVCVVSGACEAAAIVVGGVLLLGAVAYGGVQTYRYLSQSSAADPPTPAPATPRPQGGRTAVAPAPTPDPSLLPPVVGPVGGNVPTVGDNTQTGTTTTTRNGDEDGVYLNLTYRSDWTPVQRVEAEAKVQYLDFRAKLGGLRVMNAGKHPSDQRRVYVGEYGSVAGTSVDIDHMLDHQFGGSRGIDNLVELDRSVNRSLGKQIELQTRHLPEGTRIKGVSISDPATGSP